MRGSWQYVSAMLIVCLSALTVIEDQQIRFLRANIVEQQSQIRSLAQSVDRLAAASKDNSAAIQSNSNSIKMLAGIK